MSQKKFFHHEEPYNSEKNCGGYRYTVFGLNISSDILLPELLTPIDTPDSVDVSISIGKVPADITKAIEKNNRYQLVNNQFLFRVPGVGCYYVTYGNRIVVEPTERTNELLVRLFLLGTAFGALLMQRGFLPIHGSAVVINGSCVIFTGVSGAGKSSLLSAFRKQGYSFLTDDLAAVTLDADGVALVHSAYPQQKLWRDSADIIGVDTTSLTPFYTGIDREKFAIPVHKGFWQLPVKLVAVYELRSENCRAVTVSPLAGMEKLAVLMTHTYRPWLIDGLGMKAVHFKNCATVAKQVAVFRLTKPEGVFSLDEQVCLVKNYLAQYFANRAV